MVYLSPVILLVAFIGAASVAVQAASRLVHRSSAGRDKARIRLACITTDDPTRAERARRRFHATR